MDIKHGKKHIFGMAKVGEKGQIVIPKAARDLFSIKPGDQVVMVGDEKSGIAIITSESLIDFFAGIIGEAPDTEETNQ